MNMRAQHRESILETWRQHIECVDGFRSDGTSVGVRASGDESDTWIRVVRFGKSTVVSIYPGCAFANELLGVDGDLVEPALLCRVTGDPVEQLGPAELFFFDPDRDIEPTDVDLVDRSDARVANLLAACDNAEASESSVENAESTLSVVMHGSETVAACGWKVWAPAVAHLCVLTHPDYRGRGLGTRVGSDATRRAVAAGLVPQWRVREGNAISAMLGRSLGYELLGRQVSLRMPRA